MCAELGKGGRREKTLTNVLLRGGLRARGKKYIYTSLSVQQNSDKTTHPTKRLKRVKFPKHLRSSSSYIYIYM